MGDHLYQKKMAMDLVELEKQEDDFHDIIKNFINLKVTNAFDFTGISTLPQDWDDIPEITTKMLINLQAHHQALVLYLKERS